MAYEELPEAIRRSLGQKEILRGELSAAEDAVVVWVKDPSTGKQREQEYVLAEARFLTRAEREARFPAPEHLALPGGLAVEITQELEAETEVRYEVYRIERAGAEGEVLSAKQIVHGPFHRTVQAVVEDAVARQGFPAEYATWEAERRVRYWVGRLYAMRRQAGSPPGRRTPRSRGNWGWR